MSQRAQSLIRLAVQSSRRLWREALCAYLQSLPDFAVVGGAPTLTDLDDLCTQHPSDAVLLDVDLIRPGEAEEIYRFHASFPSIVIVVACASPDLGEKFIDGDVASLISSSHGLEDVLRLVRRLANPMASRENGRLTKRELDVLMLMTSGLSAVEISTLLEISPRTVESHKRNIYAKFGVNNHGQAVSRAISCGVMDQSITLTSTITPRRPRGLSYRETDVLRHLADGLTLQQSARALGITAKSVENIRTRLFRKLGSRNRSDAVTIAHRLGLIDLTDWSEGTVRTKNVRRLADVSLS